MDFGTFLQFFRYSRLLYKAPVKGLEKEVAFLGLLASNIPGKKFIKIIYLLDLLSLLNLKINFYNMYVTINQNCIKR